MPAKHPQEKVLASFEYNGIAVELAEWSETIWCGKIGYAANNADEPDVDRIAGDIASAMRIAKPAGKADGDWDVCMSVNYLSSERPNGVMFGWLVDSKEQDAAFDVVTVPAGQYMSVQICPETARALGREMWRGGIPPYEWIGEQIAPALGYRYGDDALPVFEYYGEYANGVPTVCWLYVPVQKV